MDKIARFAILGLFPFKRHGNRNCFKSRFNSRFTCRVFSFFGFYFRASLWLFSLLSSPALIADFSSSDLNEIESYLSNIYDYNIDIYNKLNDIEYDVGDIKSDADNMRQMLQNIYNGFGYSYNGAYTLRQDMQENNEHLIDIHDNITGLYDGLTSLESIYARLGEILDALDDNGTGSGSGGEIPSDIATETTLSSFKGKYEELANQFLNSWGFEGGSGGTFKESLSYIFPKTNSSNRFIVYSIAPTTDLGAISPFPVPGGTGGSWKDFMMPMFGSSTRIYSNNFLEDFGYVLGENLYGLSSIQQQNMQKQAWNDWYAHTNLISTLNTLSSPPKNYIDSSSDIGSVDSSTGEMTLTYNDSEGGSPPTPEVIDTKVVFTNDFSVLETDSNSIGENLNKITYSKLNEKYKLPEGIENNNYQDYSSKEAFPDYNLQYGPEQYQSFRFTATHRRMYNSLFSPQLCDKLRAVFSKLWFFLSIWFNFVLFKIFGKVKE